MNKTFKVIFKKEIGEYVVCNECKTTQTKGRAKRLPLICMCAFLAVPASATVVDDFNSVLAGNGQSNSPYIFTDIEHTFTTTAPVSFTVNGSNNSQGTALLQFGQNSFVNIRSDDVIKFNGDSGIAIKNNGGTTNFLAKEVLFFGGYSSSRDSQPSAVFNVSSGNLSLR